MRNSAFLSQSAVDDSKTRSVSEGGRGGRLGDVEPHPITMLKAIRAQTEQKHPNRVITRSIMSRQYMICWELRDEKIEQESTLSK